LLPHQFAPGSGNPIYTNPPIAGLSRLHGASGCVLLCWESRHEIPVPGQPVITDAVHKAGYIAAREKRRKEIEDFLTSASPTGSPPPAVLPVDVHVLDAPIRGVVSAQGRGLYPAAALLAYARGSDAKELMDWVDQFMARGGSRINGVPVRVTLAE
jgi:hypothetical protein